MAEAERKRAYRAKFSRIPSPIPPTLENKKEKENCPGHVPGQSGTLPLTLSQRISHEKELTRIGTELGKLGKLKDYDEGTKPYKRVMELTERQNELRTLLGVKA